MAQSSETSSESVEAGLTAEGEAWFAQFSDPTFLIIAGIGLAAYLFGRFVFGRRNPGERRKWWDYRRID